jgi:hypothetical protein
MIGIPKERQPLPPDRNEIVDWKIFCRYASIMVKKDQYMGVLLKSVTEPADLKVPS